jgi:hypothetical protein
MPVYPRQLEKPLQRAARSFPALLGRFERGADGVVVHGAARDEPAAASVLAPGVRAVTLERLLGGLAGPTPHG